MSKNRKVEDPLLAKKKKQTTKNSKTAPLARSTSALEVPLGASVADTIKKDGKKNSAA